MKKFLSMGGIMLAVLVMSGCTNYNEIQGNEGNNQKTSNTELLTENNEVNSSLLNFSITTGNSDSKVTLIEASDFECPACSYWHTEIAKVIAKYSDKVYFGYMPFPLSYHEFAQEAALAAESANLQDKGWEMHDRLFETEKLNSDAIDVIAKEIGLDMDKYIEDKESNELENKITESKNLLTDLGLQGTPTFYLNGVEYSKNPTFENLSADIEELLNS